MEACALAVDGQAAAAIAAARQAIVLAEQTRDAFSQALTRSVAGWIAVIVDDAPLAAEASDASVAMAEQHGFAHVALMAAVSQAWGHARLGGDPAMEAARMQAAIDGLARQGHKAEQARRFLYTADTYLLAQDQRAAAVCLAEAKKAATATGEMLPAALVERVEAGLAAAARRP